jgi:hypothetical protein
VRKALAVIGIILSSLMLLALPRSVEQNPSPPGDYAYLAGQLVGAVLVVCGLFYSVRWYLKLGGHTYKLARQAWASILFAYSLLGVLIGAALTRMSLVLGPVAALTWAAVAFGCWRWRRRLRRKERDLAASVTPA